MGRLSLGTGLGLTAQGKGGGGPPAPTTLLSDTFTGADNTALASHTMNVGGGWSQQRGASKILSNKAKGTAANENLTWADATAADVTLTFDLTWDTGDPFLWIFCRASDLNNNYQIQYQQSDGSWAITKDQAGSVVTLGTPGTSALGNGSTTAIKIINSGASITVFVGGAQVTTTAGASFNQTATLFGFDLYKAGGAPASTVDNFLVTSP